MNALFPTIRTRDNLAERNHLRGLSEKKKMWFWSKVNMKGNEGCWIWRGCITAVGYGKVKLSQVTYRAHRVAFILNGGETSEDRPYVLHSCNNKLCVNPSHLRSGSPQENENDKMLVGAQAKGSGHGSAKLNESQVLEMLRMTNNERGSAGKLSAIFGICRRHVDKILKGAAWRHISKTQNNL